MAHATRASFSNAASSEEQLHEDSTQHLRAQLSARLLNDGVVVHSQDSIDGLAALIESLENFEIAVEARGGAMSTESPTASHQTRAHPLPFVLPRRAPYETAHTYASRIDAATTRLRA